MIPSRVVTPDEALKLMQEGFVYVDVRNQDEFDQGHPAHSYNVPFILQTDFGPAPNETFVETVKQHFGLDAKLAVGVEQGGFHTSKIPLKYQFAQGGQFRVWTAA